MCCCVNGFEEALFRAKIKKWKKSYFYAWKVVCIDGMSWFGCHKYGPGTHEAEVTKKTYYTGRPRGLHVCLTYKEACSILRESYHSDKIVRV